MTNKNIKAKILMVDDRPEGLLALKAILDGPEHELLSASSGIEAVELAKAHDFAVILLDVQMPVMDGFQTAALIRQIPRAEATPIIFITAIDKDSRYVRQGYDAGAVDYIFKPLDGHVLKSKVCVFVSLHHKNLQIRRQDEALRRAYSELEQRVEERTRELSKLNRALQAEVLERQAAEERLRREKQSLERVNLELDSFVYIASHDLRAPLRTIASFAGFLDKDYRRALDGDALSYLDEIRLSATRMNRLIDDLLTVSRLSRIHNPYETVNSGNLVDLVLCRLDQEIQKHGVQVKVQGELPDIHCDSIKMKEVFVNLIGNAVKFSAKAGAETPLVEIGCRDLGDRHEFYVKDNGIGIEPRYHGEIFDMFRRLHTAEEYEGTGAGLYIVKEILKSHQGSVRVESSPGKGAAFYFTLPKKTDGAASPGPAAAASEKMEDAYAG